MLTSRNADISRALVRDMYTKSWSAFDRLVSIVPLGGAISLNDKLFSFWLLQGDSHPLSHMEGIFRFETGVKVNKFHDLRANPRCLVESQVLSFRVRWARMTSTGALGATPLAAYACIGPASPLPLLDPPPPTPVSTDSHSPTTPVLPLSDPLPPPTPSNSTVLLFSPPTITPPHPPNHNVFRSNDACGGISSLLWANGEIPVIGVDCPCCAVPVRAADNSPTDVGKSDPG
ncbi:hypothetical protein F5148DRAFT_1282145 [Russula earlei]|uniref:Uncharacterized protein n=1 Tax=Russula earlei TaxID=71964 RepID=A0ACC0UGR8_9AGAM|nr:hypothetical protein F5148DRAFT_1282145 [Russula earlei]